jgi:hypothetical protein
MLLATVAMLASCGGGSSNTTATTRSEGAGSGQVVYAKERGFSTVVPRGYAYKPGVAQYAVSADEAGGHETVLDVVHQPAGEGDISTVARRVLGALRNPTNRPKHISPLRSLSVAGEPALAVDYVPTPARHVPPQHVLLVFVRHGEWVYTIQVVASPAGYPAAYEAFEGLTRNWRWL